MNRGYTGKPYDSTTGLYDYGYRDYAPATARFTTVDPIRDGSNWFAYVHNNPVSYIDVLGLWDFNSDGTATADRGDTLAELAELVTGNGANWTRLGYTGVPEKLQKDEKVNYLGLVNTVTIYNQDPSPGQNIIVNVDQNDSIRDWWAGHSWISFAVPDLSAVLSERGQVVTFGWGPPENLSNDPAKDPLKNVSLPGTLYTANQGEPSSAYTLSVASAQAAVIAAEWAALAVSGTDYSYFGSTLLGNTFCTEAMLDVLSTAGVLNPVEKAMLIDTPYAPWSTSFPAQADITTAGHDLLANSIGSSTLPNPNEIDNRLNDLNTIRQIVTDTMGASAWNKGR
jgi:RHS repeat-associated protein